jgi:hypothetical protein
MCLFGNDNEGRVGVHHVHPHDLRILRPVSPPGQVVVVAAAQLGVEVAVPAASWTVLYVPS